MQAWRKNEGILVRDQKGLPIDFDYELAAGMDVALELNGLEYRVSVLEILSDRVVGSIKKIGPLPTIEANGLRVGDTVDFMMNHVLRIIPI